MTYGQEIRDLIAAAGTDGEAVRAHRLFEASFQNDLEEHPESATVLGISGHGDRWTDWSPEAVERRREHAGLTLDAARSIDRAELDEADRVSLDVFEHMAADAAEEAAFPEHLLILNQLAGVQVDAPFLLNAMPATTPDHVDDLLARLGALPRLVEQTIALLEEGVRTAVTAPAVALRAVPEQVMATIGDGGDGGGTSPLLAPFRRLPSSLGTARVEAATRDAEALLDDRVGPAFRRLHHYLTTAYLPSARATVGLSDLPGGGEWYAHRLRSYTTTRTTPEEVHEIGLAEVDRIVGEMAAVRTELGFEGTADEFSEHLRTDPRFVFDTSDDLLAAYRDIAKRIDATVLRLFRSLPRVPFAVVPVPAEQAPSAPAAFYLPGSLEDARPGQFFANVHDLPSRPSWNMESICLHEAVPGHHFQLTLAQELTDVPTFRRHAFVTAYLEGWGLYCESLGDELGLYTDPYQRYGALDAEVLRAVRLVTDTGIHALGWSRDRAIDYFARHSATPHHEVVTEIDRYIVLPGQALAYKTGELKLKALRARAAAALGEGFDVRAFHDEVLRHGALPLELLDRLVQRWIARVTGPA